MASAKLIICQEPASMHVIITILWKADIMIYERKKRILKIETVFV